MLSLSNQNPPEAFEATIPPDSFPIQSSAQDSRGILALKDQETDVTEDERRNRCFNLDK